MSVKSYLEHMPGRLAEYDLNRNSNKERERPEGKTRKELPRALDAWRVNEVC